MSELDRRLEIFLSGRHPEIFHAIQHRNEIWRHDPFDVESIHANARAEFETLLVRATTQAGKHSGRILLLLGESGSGKTHLIRAFRKIAHEQSKGFVGYMQMTTTIDRYDRYALSNLIESLDQPYDELRHPDSGLMRLSAALLSRCGNQVANLLRDDPDLDVEDVHQLISDSADTLISQPGYERVDLDLVRALLYLQRNDPRIRSRVLKYLRCEDLSDRDRKVLDGMVPRTGADDPERMIEQFGRLIGLLQHALVLCVDQLEDAFNPQAGIEPFQSAVKTLCSLADRVPSSVIVICCLKDLWTELKFKLPQSIRDRLEQDPNFITLESGRTSNEAREIAARRLMYLYDVEGAHFDEADSTFPIPFHGFGALSNLRTRAVLNHCRQYREKAIHEGRLPNHFPLDLIAADAEPGNKTETLDQEWNDARSVYQGNLSESTADILVLLDWALRASADELALGETFQIRQVKELLHVDSSSGSVKFALALCNSGAQRGALLRQLFTAKEAAGDRTLVVLRTYPFPTSPTGETNKELAKLIKKGARKAVMEDSEHRAILALREFREKYKTHPNLLGWLRQTCPLTQMKVMRDILDLDNLPGRLPSNSAFPPSTTASSVTRASDATPPPAVIVPPTLASPDPEWARGLLVGYEDGVLQQSVYLAPDELTQHSAFLGGSGSGKTTAALNLIEQLVLRGVPAILLDRKGDLAGYARKDAWDGFSNERLEQRRNQLRARIDVALFTPGDPRGRPLAIPLLPSGLGALPEFDRQQATEYAAEALGSMLDYKHQGRDKKCRIILGQALDLLVQLTPDKNPTLEQLIRFIYEEDPQLASVVARLDPKLMRKVAEDLEALKLGASKLLASDGEQLDIDLLLGRGQHAKPGRTRLSVISTKFLGDTNRILFWVSQFLIELSRWMSQRPSSSLQAVVMFDEADVYLPAVGQPSTKQPMENLLKRARSAGLGLMLATQSPGDFDYKCRDTIRTWFLGRIKEQNSLDKLKPMLSEVRIDVASKLGGLRAGEFFVARERQATRVRAQPSGLATEQMSEEDLLRLAYQTRAVP